MELLKGQHGNARAIPKSVIEATISTGFRMVSLQSKATEGARNHRLDAWYHIRRIGFDELWRGLQAEGRSNEVSHKELKVAMETQKAYHVVVRGNDPKFFPPGDLQGTDLVTNYIVENLQFVRDEVDKHLFDELHDPSAIRDAMDNPVFDQMLQAYFENADKKKDETLHIASRFRGGSNLLHSCIKEGYADTLDLLLSSYTVECNSRAPWRVLAEPLRAVGKFKITAFHRAVYDGKPECLRRLVDWAVCTKHDITLLKNVEDRNELTGAPARELTCLELAEQEGNFECYNILAGLFGVPPKENARDQKTREARHALLSTPRVEIRRNPAEILATTEISSYTWQQVITTVADLLSQVESQNAGLDGIEIHICRVEFADDVSAELVSMLRQAVQGKALIAEGCTMQSDLTMIEFLRDVVEQLSLAASAENISGDFPGSFPCKVDIASRVAQTLSPSEERDCDEEVLKLLEVFVRLAGRVPGFLGARNGMMSQTQKQRLTSRSDGGRAAAIAWAAVYGTRINSFIYYKQSVDEGISYWKRQRELMPLARMIYKEFFSVELLLQKEFVDPRDAVHPGLGQFLQQCLEAWFARFPSLPSPVDPWERWAGSLGADPDLVQQELAPALDLVLETLLRMGDVLDYNFRRNSCSAASVADLLRKCVPEELFRTRMPTTKRLLEQTGGISKATPPPLSRPRPSLMSTSASLRPGGGR